MASTITISRTITQASQYLRNTPLNFSGQQNDPGLSIGDWVRQIILSPPFAWRWNRSAGTFNVPTFVTTPGVSDYSVSLPTFGWMEKAVMYDPADAYAAMELQVDLIKGADLMPNQSSKIAAQYDDGEGNITFRLFPAPDKAYNVVVEFQKAAPLFATTTDTWAPLPDYLSYIYAQGFLAKSCEYWSDSRFPTSMQLFFQNLAAVSEGLTESEKNLWLHDRLVSIREMSKAQQGH